MWISGFGPPDLVRLHPVPSGFIRLHPVSSGRHSGVKRERWKQCKGENGSKGWKGGNGEKVKKVKRWKQMTANYKLNIIFNMYLRIWSGFIRFHPVSSGFIRLRPVSSGRHSGVKRERWKQCKGENGTTGWKGGNGEMWKRWSDENEWHQTINSI